MEPEKVVGFEGEANEVSYTKRDLLLYALGIGCVCTYVWWVGRGCWVCFKCVVVCARGGPIRPN